MPLREAARGNELLEKAQVSGKLFCSARNEATPSIAQNLSFIDRRRALFLPVPERRNPSSTSDFTAQIIRRRACRHPQHKEANRFVMLKQFAYLLALR